MPRPLSARASAAVYVCVALLACAAQLACTPQGDPGLEAGGFRDDFNRLELGPNWRATRSGWEVRDGQLHARGARNHPLWLRRTLPHDVRVTFTARSESPDGDIKCELFGDGVSYAKDIEYDATSYVVILGGWHNTLNVLARMKEHGADRVVGKQKKVIEGHAYHVEIERRGALLTVRVDGEELMRLDDPNPLAGRGHDHFAFNDWESSVWFDDLTITPL